MATQRTPLLVTTSWDDGDVLDMRLTDLLDRYGLRGTFYISKDYLEKRLSDDEIRSIAMRHEIGAHTLTHPNLTRISKAEKEKEIQGSKEWLEEVLKAPVPMFCYPAGHYDEESKEVVAAVGFRGARTTEFGRLDTPKDPFAMSTTLSVYPMPLRKLDKTHYYWGKILQPFIERMPKMLNLGVPLYAARSFEAFACAAFDAAQKEGGVFHLWGHSWEIERYGLWDELERVFAYIGGRADCRYVTNGELIPNTTAI